MAVEIKTGEAVKWDPIKNNRTRVAPKPTDTPLDGWTRIPLRVNTPFENIVHGKADTWDQDHWQRILVDQAEIITHEGQQIVRDSDTPFTDGVQRFAYEGSYTEHRQGEDHDEPSEILEAIVDGPDRYSDKRFVGALCGDTQGIVVERISEVTATRKPDGTLKAEVKELPGILRASVRHIARKVLNRLHLPFDTDEGFIHDYHSKLHEKTTHLRWRVKGNYPIKPIRFKPKRVFGT